MAPRDPDLSFLTLPDVTLQVATAGPRDGTPTILLHGFPEAWFGWRNQINALAASGLRIIVPDQRGYNRSSKPRLLSAYHLDRLADDVLALADHFGAEQVQVVGHDWGGIIAWWLAARNPERIRRLVILNAPHPDVIGAYTRRHPIQALRSSYAAAFQIPRLPEAALRAGNFRALRQTLRLTSRPGTFTEADLERYAEAWTQRGAPTGMLNWYRALRLKRRTQDGPIGVPTHILWGRKDFALSPGLAMESLARCTQGQLTWFPEATHWLHHEAIDAVNMALRDFLTR
ncbi:alpha/beta hydrolase [Methylobacterium sp. Leaf113]|uniref:alpha/beta fold hydrolase n=1 Tax=Methylobacterium sp. Leaf113 TaxID=1736259 RepID=UPI0006F612C8|nr:alpha/beta hydrolase [Methylobacterium sp. Leaf113]KQP92339.1 alpha/beta hydrolase [Methylobacterium sp. Leaf113]